MKKMKCVVTTFILVHS